MFIATRSAILAIALIMAGFSMAVTAQEHHIYGKVLDEESHSAISEVNISISETKLGCTTNKDGEFSFITISLPVFIVISHLGYETQQLRLDKASGGFTILLKPVTAILKEVEIKAIHKPEIFFKDDQYSVLDYEVDSSLVYLLIFRSRLAKAELLCKSVDGDTVARSGTFTFKPTGLFLDCLGILHVLSKDSAYQVYRKNDNLIIPYAFDIRKFNSTISDCLASTDNWLFFRKESFDHQTVDFYRINRTTSQRQAFASSRDEANIKMLRKNSLDLYFLLLDTIPDGNANLTEWSWVKKILYKPNASVLHRLGDTISVFNTTNGNVDIYDLNAKLLTSMAFPVKEKNKGDWTKEIYVDRMVHKPYTSFLENGKLTFYQIDLHTGELTRTLTASHVFPGKPRIHGNFIYYLYDLPGTGDNKYLFRQKAVN
jgi:hypothetical protein